MLHPATFLVFWICFALILQVATLSLLAGLVAVSFLLAATLAPTRGMRLLRRSRWLLLSIGVLFLFFSPGEYLPGLAGRMGLTYEGVTHAGEQIGRLLAILLSLALLHEGIGTPGLLAGLYKLLGPFSWRETTVVRLMLVLEFVEDKRVTGWREWLSEGAHADSAERNHFALVMPHLRRLDLALMGGLAAATFLCVFR